MGWAGLLIAVLAAFMDIPYSGAILVVLGLIIGYTIAAEDHVRVLVTALVLGTLSGVLNEIPEIGFYLAKIFGGIGVLTAGAALMIISRNVYNRFKP
jgi:hypothetical protein